MNQRMLAYAVVIARPLAEFKSGSREPLDLLTGSGTLIRKGKQAGILTAGHVIPDLKEGEFLRMTILRASGRDQAGPGGGVIFTEVRR